MEMMVGFGLLGVLILFGVIGYKYERYQDQKYDEELRQKFDESNYPTEPLTKEEIRRIYE